MYVIVTTQFHTSAITVAHTCAYIDAPLSHPLITHMTFGDKRSQYFVLAGILHGSPQSAAHNKCSSA